MRSKHFFFSVSLHLYMPIIYQETFSLFIIKRYLIFLFLFWKVIFIYIREINYLKKNVFFLFTFIMAIQSLFSGWPYYSTKSRWTNYQQKCFYVFRRRSRTSVLLWSCRFPNCCQYSPILLHNSLHLETWLETWSDQAHSSSNVSLGQKLWFFKYLYYQFI